MAVPGTVKVEVAFTTQPMNPSPSWTDVTPYFLAASGLSVKRGRPDEFSQVDDGTISLALNNSDGRFTRGLTSSPYYPNVRNGRRIRYTVAYTPKNWVSNPSFEVNTTGWTVGGSVPPTLARSNTHAQDGTWAGLVTWGTGGAFPQIAMDVSGLLPGHTYTASAYVYVPSGGSPACKLAISGGPVGTPSNTTNAFQRITLTFTATLSTHNLQVWPDTSPTSGQQVWVDAVQVEAGSGATTFDATIPVVSSRFDGHVNQWPTSWVSAKANLATAEITATDRMKRLGQVGEFRAMVSEEILRDVVAPDATHGSAYYPLGEDSGATSGGNVTAQLQDPLLIVQRGSGGTVEFGSGTGPGTDALSAPLFTPVDAQNGKYLKAQLRTGIGGTTGGITLEAFIRCDQGQLGRSIAAVAGRFDSRIILSVNSSGGLTVLSWQWGQGEIYRLDSGGPLVNDNQTHHVAVTESITGSTVTAVLYQDGAQVGTTTYTATGLMTADRLFVGGDPWERWGVFPGTLSHVAAHSAALSAARIAVHFNAGANGLQGESADTRLGRFADWLNIPSADRALDASAATVGAQQTSGIQPVEAMRQIEALEQGVLFMAGDSKLTFHARGRRYNQTPAFTLDAALKQVPPDLEFPGDDFGLTNDMTVSRPDGASARITDQVSIDEFGLYRDSAEIPAGSTDELASAASWRVFTYGQPRTRISQVTVNLHDPRVASLLPSLLAADISTKIRLSNLPAQAPASTVDVFVEGISEQRTTDTWQLVFNTSPGDVSDVWQLGVAGHSELGVTTRVAMRTTAVPLVGIYSDTYSNTY